LNAQSLQFLTDLVNCPSPSGYEAQAAALFKTQASAFADEVTTDINGNVTAVLNPDASMKILLAGHMDEIGFIIHHIDDAGLLYFSTIGGHDSAVPLGQMLWVHGRRRLAGLVGRKPIDLMDPAELQKKPNSASCGSISAPVRGKRPKPLSSLVTWPRFSMDCGDARARSNDGGIPRA